ncbi:MAG: thiamine phosphate synthase, partial [Deltaproteobacteria bacterium]|nr:thiamine phosphate synthase [Deltaproteobacteria bacterium]
FALGGIKLERVAEVLDAGAAGVALISAILAQPDPESSTRDFLQRLHVAGNI